mgnify:CR=1 FL=1
MQQMVTCSRCGQPNQPGQRYCWHCGNTLATGCPNCGAGLDPGSRFCGNCGAQLPPTQQAGGWEQPPPQQQAWGQPPPQQQSWGQPQPQQQTWGSPSPQPSWEQPPPQQQSWGQPPPQQQSWGPPPGAWNQPMPGRSGAGGLVLLLIVLLIGLGAFSYFAFFSDNPPWGKTTLPGGGTTVTTPITEGPFFFVKSTDNAAGKATMELKWKTNELYKGKVEYGEAIKGEDIKYGKTTELESDFVKDHVAPLPDLKMSTSYHYRITLIDKNAKEWKSEGSIFKTPAPPSQ